MRKRAIFLIGLLIVLVLGSTAVLAKEKVKLTGYVIPAMCAAEHANDKAEDVAKFAAEHSKECGLMEKCVKSGFGVMADGKWYLFDEKGNDLAKTLIQKTTRKDGIKVTVEGVKEEGKILVEKLTETE